MSHAKIADMLPWYVNGTLPEKDRAAVEHEIETCPECAAELESLKALQQRMLDVEAGALGPSQFLFNRTIASIEELERKRAAQPSFAQWWSARSLAARAGLIAAPIALLLFAATMIARFTAGQPEVALAPPPAPVLRSYGPVTTAMKAQVSVGAPLTEEKQKAAGTGGVAMDALDKSAVAQSANTATTLAKAETRPAFARPQLIRTGSISLLVPDVEKTIKGLQTIAQMQFGDVLALDDTTPTQPGERHVATLNINVPQDRFSATMDAIAQLGGVQTRSVSAQDVTDQIVDSTARLKNLRHTEDDLLRIMDRQGKVADLLDVQNQISSTRDEIERLDASLKSMQHRVAYSAIAISLEDEIPSSTVSPGAGTQLGDSWRVALRDSKELALRIVAGVLRAIAFAPYWIIPLGLAWWLLARLFRRPAY
jgi:anti-sigma factor RsiW